MTEIEELHVFLDENSLQQTDFAKQAGVDDSFVSKWLSGERNIPLYVLNYIRGVTSELKAPMSQRDTQSLWGLTPSTKSNWGKKNNPKHNMFLIIDSLSYKEALQMIVQIKTERNYTQIEEAELLKELEKKEK